MPEDPNREADAQYQPEWGEPFIIIKDGSRAWYNVRWHERIPNLVLVSFRAQGTPHYFVKDISNFRWPIGMLLSEAYGFFADDGGYDAFKFAQTLKVMGYVSEESWQRMRRHEQTGT